MEVLTIILLSWSIFLTIRISEFQHEIWELKEDHIPKK